MMHKIVVVDDQRLITAVDIDGSTIVYRLFLDFMKSTNKKKAKIEISDTRMHTFLLESGLRHKNTWLVYIQEDTGKFLFNYFHF